MRMLMTMQYHEISSRYWILYAVIPPSNQPRRTDGTWGDALMFPAFCAQTASWPNRADRSLTLGSIAPNYMMRHDMVTISALLALCEWNPPVSGGFPSQRTNNIDRRRFFSICSNKMFNKQSSCQWCETPRPNVTSLCWSSCNDDEDEKGLRQGCDWGGEEVETNMKLWN